MNDKELHRNPRRSCNQKCDFDNYYLIYTALYDTFVHVFYSGEAKILKSGLLLFRTFSR